MGLQADFLSTDGRGDGSQGQEDCREVFRHRLILTDGKAYEAEEKGRP